jgi:hypothetical protein
VTSGRRGRGSEFLQYAYGLRPDAARLLAEQVMAERVRVDAWTERQRSTMSLASVRPFLAKSLCAPMFVVRVLTTSNESLT